MSSDDPVLGERSMEDVPADECLRLVAEVPVGRVVLVEGDQPVALPVNHAVVDGAVVFTTVAGSLLDRTCAEGAPIAYEVDDVARSAPFGGWSVLVKGLLARVEDPVERAALDRLELYSWHPHLSRREWDRDAAAWVPAADVVWLRVEARETTGRRTTPG